MRPITPELIAQARANVAARAKAALAEVVEAPKESRTDVAAKLWGQLIEKYQGFCWHCFWLKAIRIQPLRDYVWRRKEHAFERKFGDYNDEHKFTREEISALYSALYLATQDGKLDFLFAVLGDANLSSLNHYNKEDVVIPAAPPENYTFKAYKDVDELMAAITGKV